MNYSLTNSDTTPGKGFDADAYIRAARERRHRLLHAGPRREAKDPVTPFFAPTRYREVVTPQGWDSQPRRLMMAIVDQELAGTGIKYRDVAGPGRELPILRKRFDCIARIKRELGYTDGVIANFFNRDRTTIVNALHRRGLRGSA